MVLLHVYVEVTEATLGIDFYCHGLGLTLKRRLSPTWIELAGANCPFIFLLIGQRLRISAVQRYAAATNGTGRRFTWILLCLISTQLSRD